MNIRKQSRLRRAAKTRAKIKQLGAEKGTARLVVNRSSRHIYVQVVAPKDGKVLAQASSLELRAESVDGGKIAAAKKVGALLGDRAKQAGVKAVACDRSGFKYHGRVAALVDAAREAGVEV
ncbi:MAG: 50S ribosomal protein L18 [Legionellales bacterium]|nr:50S ribosomal protein L18 [Legionellales bacterium]|tara:strand:+ start:334 stop:696 length:363 start_codon:yes stop_codon:yes gene_type:complete